MKAQVDLTVCCLPSRVHELILSFADIKDSSTRKVRDAPFSQLRRKKNFSHIPELKKKVVKLRLEDRIGMKRKVVLKEEDPRRIAPTLAPAPPPTCEIVEEKKSRLGK